MKRLIFSICILLSLHAFPQIERYLPAMPDTIKLVNDLTKDSLLTAWEAAMLERKLVAYDDSTSSQVAIVIVEDLHGYAAVDFATELGRKWGVGGGRFNNGIVILVSTGGGSGNRDVFIAVGYGLEGAITDATAGYITDHIMIPQLRAGRYFQAFDEATDALILAAAGEYSAPPGYRSRRSGNSGAEKLIGGLVVLFIVIMIFISGRNNRGGGYVSRRGYRGFGGPVIFPGTFGHGRGGGFGGGGGGFGGFGGGSFGGGGAGGKW